MKSISAEDDVIAMARGRNFGILVLFIAVVLLIATSLFITPLAVSDSDPSTYVIVPTIMLPLLIIFSAKAKAEPRVNDRDIIIGAALFAAFILSTLVLRFEFSFFFVGFRLDLLMLPLAIAAAAILIFGTENLAKFKGPLLYALFASPVVLFVIINEYSAFTSLNTVIVYELLKPFVVNVSYVAPTSINANGNYIGIGQACVSLGIFIALALFLAPIAYLYDGKGARKALWVASGVALLFFLNISRMLLASYAWLTGGPSASVAWIHSFVGVLLFYVAIAAMILFAGRYGLTLESKNPRKRSGRASAGTVSTLSIVLVLAFAATYLLSTISYASALEVSPLALANNKQFNMSNGETASSVAGIIGAHNFTSYLMTDDSGKYVYARLTNATINSTNPIVMIITSPDPAIIKGIEAGSTVMGDFRFVNRNGAREDVLDVVSNDTEFFVYVTNVPFLLKNVSSSIASAYVIIPESVLRSTACRPDYDSTYAGLLNVFNFDAYNQKARDDALTALCVSERIVWSQ
ncbi:Transmembrane exosortase (Exosortase_EpsH) [uncultured archaeon]|nr:Transmembrane exosortase (Exosortase_EpsH) [uncultured archaeon]